MKLGGLGNHSPNLEKPGLQNAQILILEMTYCTRILTTAAMLGGIHFGSFVIDQLIDQLFSILIEPVE